MKLFKETDDIWRLYRREWVVVHSVPTVHDDHPGTAETVYDTARSWAQDNLKDRVHERDIRVVVHTDNHGSFWAQIEVFKDNLKGEFKHLENVQTYAAVEHYDEFTIVPRNSKSDHAIRSYGVVKL